jgi:hypothetical protein
MDVLLSCPWCESDVAVSEEDLRGEIRCDECAVAFGFAPDAGSSARPQQEAA